MHIEDAWDLQCKAPIYKATVNALASGICFLMAGAMFVLTKHLRVIRNAWRFASLKYSQFLTN